MSGGPYTPVGVMGGTFDPIHHGHLRSAVELCECLNLAQLRLMPCSEPPHRESTASSAQHRAAMVEFAVGGDEKLVCDTRELQRSGPSFTIDSLIELKGELGEQASISLIMGCDAVLDIASWYRWQEVLDWAHVVVIARPGWHFPDRGPVAQWLKNNALQDSNGITLRAAGGVHIKHLRPLQISSTEIRSILDCGLSARYLMPESVLDYIEKHRLYRKSHTNLRKGKK